MAELSINWLVDAPEVVYGAEYADSIDVGSTNNGGAIMFNQLWAKNKSNIARPCTWNEPTIVEGSATIRDWQVNHLDKTGVVVAEDVNSGVLLADREQVMLIVTVDNESFAPGDSDEPGRLVWNVEVTPI